MIFTRRSLILGLLGTALSPARLARADTRIVGGPAFGSSWRIITQPDVDMGQVSAAISDQIDETDRQMSPFRPASDLSRFNASKSSDWQEMPPEICHVTGQALRISELTRGAFDPTLGPLTARYWFGPIKGSAGHFSQIAHRTMALRKSDPDLTLDLCGIAKGFALDRIVDILPGLGVQNALVEIGGEVRTLGRHPDDRNWHVAIADPAMRDFRAHRVIDPKGQALATSGHASNGLTGRFETSHIIDTRRHRPASTNLLSVSVLAPRAIEADALATALCALGPENGVAFARRQGLSALFILDRSSGMADVMTGRFSQHLLI